MEHIGAMDAERVCTALDLDSVVCPQEQTETLGTGVAFGGDRGYIAAEWAVRI